MGEQSEELKLRAKRFALEVCGFLKTWPCDEPANMVRRQLAKSSMSVAANYRATCRARSRAEFIAKLGIVAEEADESKFWLEFAREAQLGEAATAISLLKEATELAAIFSASLGTARKNNRTSK